MNVYPISNIRRYNMGYSPSLFSDLEKLFSFMGSEAELEANELNVFFWDYSWSEQAKSLFKPTEKETWYNYDHNGIGSYYFTYENFFKVFMNLYGFTVIEYEETTLFESSRLDIVTMNFVVSDGVNIYTSFNNLYKRD